MLIIAFHLTLVDYLDIGQPSAFVVFFLLITGFFTASVIRGRKGIDIEKPMDSTLRFIGKRIMAFFPYLVASSIIIPMVLLTNIDRFHNTLAQSVTETVLTFFGDISLLVMTGLPGTMGNVATWYLSGMVIALFITVPLMIIFKDGFTKWAAPIIGSLCIGYILGSGGGLLDPFRTIGIFREGLLFCIGSICIGYFLYEVVQKMRSLTFSKFGKNALSAIELSGWIAAILMPIFANDIDPYSASYYVMLETVLVITCTAITCSGSSSIALDTTDRPRLNRLSKMMATASLIMYLSNYYQFYFASRYLGQIKGWTLEQQWIFIAVSFVLSCILVYLIGRLLVIIGRSLKKRMLGEPIAQDDRV